jgi:hypothetical protein
MSMPGPWDLPRRVQIALVAYCKTVVGPTVMVEHARSVRVIGFPCVICEATGHEPMDDAQNFTGRRRITGAAVVMMTEAINRKFDETKFATAAEMHADMEAALVGAFAGNAVHDDLNSTLTEGVVFSRCYMAAVECDAAEGKLLTTINLEIEAQPKEL